VHRNSGRRLAPRKIRRRERDLLGGFVLPEFYKRPQPVLFFPFFFAFRNWTRPLPTLPQAFKEASFIPPSPPVRSPSFLSPLKKKYFFNNFASSPIRLYLTVETPETAPRVPGQMLRFPPFFYGGIQGGTISLFLPPPLGGVRFCSLISTSRLEIQGIRRSCSFPLLKSFFFFSWPGPLSPALLSFRVDCKFPSLFLPYLFVISRPFVNLSSLLPHFEF